MVQIIVHLVSNQTYSTTLATFHSCPLNFRHLKLGQHLVYSCWDSKIRTYVLTKVDLYVMMVSPYSIPIPFAPNHSVISQLCGG